MVNTGTGAYEATGDTSVVRPRFRLWFFSLFALLILLLTLSLLVWSELTFVPEDFPVQQIVTIPQGASLRDIATLLEETHTVRSNIAFMILVKCRGAESRLVAGDYLFVSPLTLGAVSLRLISGEHGIKRLRVTLPEGTSVRGMGRIFKKTFAHFDEAQFVAQAEGGEGYLFPDTYFFFSNATSGPIIKELSKNFLEKTGALKNEALASKKNWAELIVMASIIEEEGVTPEDRRMISGILWKRLAQHIHLQVDAPFAYAIGKNSATLTLDDLQSDSPYNTYRNYGLPPTPISNPGLDAIDAALHPTPSPYFFYLSGKDGVMHYAKTFAEHKKNKERYLH